MTAEDDVDSFGMLSPLVTQSPVELSSVRAVALSLPMSSIDGDGNTAVGRDFVQIGQVVFSEIPEWESRAHARRRRGRGLQDREALRRLKANYVIPPGLLPESALDESRTALQILSDERVLILSAPTACGGQFAAALRLGYELQKGDRKLVVREELIDEDFTFSAGDMLNDQEHAVVLLDMRGVDGDFRQVRHALVEFAGELEGYQSYLILIVPHEEHRTFAERFPGRVHELGKPPAIEVLARYSADFDAVDLTAEREIQVQLERMWPPRLRELAESVERRVRRGEGPVEALRDALSGDKVNLRAEIGKRQNADDSEWLALLIGVRKKRGIYL